MPDASEPGFGSAHQDRAALAQEFRYIEDSLLDLPSARPRVRGGDQAWTELENWLRLEGLM